MGRVRIFWAAALSSVVAFPSSLLAAPPPPPNSADLVSLQDYIAGLTTADDEKTYGAMADDLRVTRSGVVTAKSKAEWMQSVWSHLAGGPDHGVTIDNVYYGIDPSATGDFSNKAQISERVERVLGHCCIYHRMETLTFRGGKIARIDRSDELATLLKPNGHRQEEP